jgi:hypothetical protein
MEPQPIGHALHANFLRLKRELPVLPAYSARCGELFLFLRNIVVSSQVWRKKGRGVPLNFLRIASITRIIGELMSHTYGEKFLVAGYRPRFGLRKHIACSSNPVLFQPDTLFLQDLFYGNNFKVRIPQILLLRLSLYATILPYIQQEQIFTPPYMGGVFL